MPYIPMPENGRGNITYQRTPSGSWRARTRFRDSFGLMKEKEASGKTKAEARQRLMHRIEDSRTDAAGGGGVLHRRATVNDLLDYFLSDLPNLSDGPSPDTISNYDGSLKHIRSILGPYEVRRVTAGLVDTSIKSVPTHNLRRKTRSHLERAFNLAVLYGVVASNPVSPTQRYSKAKKDVQDIRIEDIQRVRDAVNEWCSSKRPGPKNTDMVDLVELLLGTGCRIGELLALRWSDIDLTSEPPTLRVSGMIRDTRSLGTHRVDGVAKTESSLRKMVLPPFAVKALRIRRIAQAPNELDAVFITRRGTWHSVSNMETRWGKIRDASDLPYITFHSFRRTVATQIDKVAGARGAAGQLGHSDEGQTAERHYINREKKTIDMSDAIERFLAPPPDSDTGT